MKPIRRGIFDIFGLVQFIMFLGISDFLSSHLTVTCFLSRVTLQLTLEGFGEVVCSSLTRGPATRSSRGRLSIGNLQGHVPCILDWFPRATSRPKQLPGILF